MLEVKSITAAKGAPARSLAGDWGVLGADLCFQVREAWRRPSESSLRRSGAPPSRRSQSPSTAVVAKEKRDEKRNAKRAGKKGLRDMSGDNLDASEAASRAGGCPRSEVGNSEGRRQKGGPEGPPLRISELEENLLGLLARAREEAVVDLEGEGAQAGAVMPGDVSAALEHGSHCDDFPGGIGADICE